MTITTETIRVATDALTKISSGIIRDEWGEFTSINRDDMSNIAQVALSKISTMVNDDTSKKLDI